MQQLIMNGVSGHVSTGIWIHVAILIQAIGNPDRLCSYWCMVNVTSVAKVMQCPGCYSGLHAAHFVLIMFSIFVTVLSLLFYVKATFRDALSTIVLH